jgi:hypothetical protein
MQVFQLRVASAERTAANSDREKASLTSAVVSPHNALRVRCRPTQHNLRATPYRREHHLVEAAACQLHPLVMPLVDHRSRDTLEL